MKTRPPNLKAERRLFAEGHQLIASFDEVGRGALGGPVSVGVVVIDSSFRRGVAGVRDSKILTYDARAKLVPRIRRWAVGNAVAHASAAEIDQIGILRALRLAGERALELLAKSSLVPDCILLDGNYDWLTRPDSSLFSPAACTELPVTLLEKADLTCASVAAASVLAKVERDCLMERMAQDHPGYGWEHNRGYATEMHRRALETLGPCAQHRRSWNLLGLNSEGNPDHESVDISSHAHGIGDTSGLMTRQELF